MSTWAFDLGQHSSDTAAAAQQPRAFNVELSFRLDDDDAATRRRRLTLIGQALKDIAWRDDRMVSWEVASVATPGWVHIMAIVTASAPGEVAALSERWMRTAIAAANLATDDPCVQLPQQRRIPTQAPIADALEMSRGSSLDSVTAQVSADT